MHLDFPYLKSIWLADDDPDDCELFEDAVKQIIPQVSFTSIPNGDKLMNLLESGNVPDILFLDINMPLKNGLDCLIEIRIKRKFSRLPIVMFSNSKETISIDTCYGYGANLYYPKPTSFNNLIAGLSQLFQLNWNDPFTITSQHYINNRFVCYEPA